MLVAFVATVALLLALAAVGTLAERRRRRVRRERAMADAQLRASEHKFSTLFRNSPLPLLITSEETGRIVECSLAAETLARRTAAEIIGGSVFDLQVYRSAEQRREQLSQLGTDAAVLAREFRYEVGQHEELILLAHTTRLTLDDVPYLLTALTDITELRRLEERLLGAQRMEVIGQIAGGVAHEFNNLLTVMQAHTDALAAALGTSVLLRHADALRRAVAQATQITGGLLTFARRKPLNEEAIDPRAVIRELTSMIESLLGPAIPLTLDLGPAADLVRIDRTQLAQILINLALNSRDAMPDGGHLTIATRRAIAPGGPQAALRAEGLAEGVVVTVADTGRGMSDDIRQHVFEPFFSTKEPGQGTGLGLSICHGITEHAGGHIEVDSTPGAGTSIRVWLPRADAGPATTDETSRPAAPLPRQGQTVLLVDDEDDVRELVAEILEQADYKVYACNGLAAVEVFLARHVSIDLLLTDLVLPRGGGLDVAKAVKARQPEVPVLFISGYSESVYSGQRAVEHLLPKPFSSHVLLKKVREMIGMP